MEFTAKLFDLSFEFFQAVRKVWHAIELPNWIVRAVSVSWVLGGISWGRYGSPTISWREDKQHGGVAMCAKRIGFRVSSKPQARESIQDLMMRASLLEQQALRENDPARRLALQTEAGDLQFEARQRLKRCVVSRSVCASGE